MRNIDGWRPLTVQSALARDEIELRMRALREHVPGLRALAAERAMRADHDLDFVDDIRLAVDEVCAIMLANCGPEDTLTIRLAVDPDCVRIDAAVPVSGPPDVGGLSMRVLLAIADSLGHGVEGTGEDRLLQLRFDRLKRPRTLP